MRSNEPLGVLLVGYDGAGTQNHQMDMYEPAVVAHDEIRVLGVTDMPAADDRLRISRQRSEVLGVPYIEDLGSALLNDEVDAVVACVGFSHRVDLVRLAAAAGKHVLMDKPMALSLGEVDEIARHAGEAGIVCMPAHHLRYRHTVQQAAAALAAGEIGEPVAVQGDFIVTAGATIATADRPSVWPLGELMNFVVYPIDSIRALTGREPVDVYATRGGFFFGGTDDEDFGVLSVGFEGGMVATVSVGRAPVAGHLDGLTHRYRIVGTEGVLDVDANNPGALVHGGGRSRRVPYVTEPNSVTVLLDRFVEAVRGEGTRTVGPDDARASLAVTLAARRSADTGRIVTL